MLGWILGGMLAISLGAGWFGGRMDLVSQAAMTGGGEAVELALSLTGMLALWGGLMRIAEHSGLTTIVSRCLEPITRLLFPSLREGERARELISMNMTANLLGLGNAAPPLGLAAMKELSRRAGHPSRATREVVTFVVLNTASIQLLPATNALLRLQAGSEAPLEILPAVWLTSAAAVTVSLLLARGGREKK